MDDEKKLDFASAMFRKGSNTVDLVFAREFNERPSNECWLTKKHDVVLDAMLYCYLLGACACINDQASFIELCKAIDNVWR